MPFYGPRVVTNGLVLCLDAANPKSYPGSGSTWYDLSGLKNYFTLSGGYSLVDGTMDFDGVNGYVYSTTNYVNDGIIGTGNIAYSMEAWAMIRSNPGDTTSGYSIIGNAASTGIGLQFMRPSANQVNFGYRTNSNFYSVGGIVLNNWYHIVGTKIANGNSHIYINGQLDTTYTTTTFMDIDATSAQMQIGYAATRITGRYDGQIAIVKLYNTTLTASDVLQNFNAQRGRFGI